jgi:hypothetical protein
MELAHRSIHRPRDGTGHSDLINFAATASFVVDESTASLSVKITWVVAREDGDWKIVSHHVSSQAPLL